MTSTPGSGWGPPQQPGRPGATGWGSSAPTPGWGSGTPTGAPLPTPAAPPAAPARRRSRAPMVLLAILVIGALVAGGVWLARRGDESQLLRGRWQVVTSQAGDVSVQFPGEPSTSTRSVDLRPGVTVSGDILDLGDGGLAKVLPGAVFVESDLAPLGFGVSPNTALLQPFLGQAAGGAMESIGATAPTAVAPVELPDVAVTFESTGQDGGLVVLGVVGVRGTKLFGILVTVPRSERALGERVRRHMIDSLSWVGATGG
ncbi:MAG: hypothetical protein U0Q22_07930 [Acidimicrobiales bacterium]